MQNTDITAGKPLSGNIVLEGSVMLWWYRAVVKVVRQSLAVSIAVTAVCSNGNCIVRQKWIRINIRFLIIWWDEFVKVGALELNANTHILTILFMFTPVAGANTWNDLPFYVTSAQSLASQDFPLLSFLLPEHPDIWLTYCVFFFFFWHSLWILQQLTLFRPR